MNNNHSAPYAELFINTGCAYCPAVLTGLSELLKQGLLGELHVFNLAQRPELAAERGIRSVPWMRIGPFRLEGSYTAAQLRDWAQRAGNGEGMADYFGELLENQQIDQALALVKSDPEQLHTLVGLIGDLETPMGVRIGVAAMFEELAEHGLLSKALPALAPLAQAAAPQVRADAAYYLGLIGAPAKTILEALLHDPDAEVREIAREALADMGDT